MNELVKRFLDLRAKREELKSSYEIADGALQEEMNAVQKELHSYMKENGVDSVKTPMGTAYTKLDKKVSVGDWNAFHNFCMGRGDLSMIQKRPSSTAVLQYLDETGSLPPGCSLYQEYIVLIRKSPTKA